MTAWLVGAATAALAPAAGIAALAPPTPRWTFAAATAGLYLAGAVQAWRMSRRIGSFGPLAALAFPLPLAFFHAVYARSVRLARRGSATWRGRVVPIRPGDRGVSPASTSGAIRILLGRLKSRDGGQM